MQVLSGAPKVLFTMFSPRKEIIMKKEEMVSVVVNEQVHIAGEYALCFNNIYGYRKKTIIGIVYDAHLDESPEGKFIICF